MYMASDREETLVISIVYYPSSKKIDNLNYNFYTLIKISPCPQKYLGKKRLQYNSFYTFASE